MKQNVAEKTETGSENNALRPGSTGKQGRRKRITNE